MKTSPDLLHDFKTAFVSVLNRMEISDLESAWATETSRTNFYKDVALQEVAQVFGLDFCCEEFKIDYTFCRAMPDGYQVPVVFIESENQAHSAQHEVRKLCCLNAPLKVLITCSEWDADFGRWKHGGFKNRLMPQWTQQIAHHGSIWPTPSITGFIVGEWSDKLRFYAFGVNHVGELIDSHRLIWEKK